MTKSTIWGNVFHVGGFISIITVLFWPVQAFSRNLEMSTFCRSQQWRIWPKTVFSKSREQLVKKMTTKYNCRTNRNIRYQQRIIFCGEWVGNFLSFLALKSVNFSVCLRAIYSLKSKQILMHNTFLLLFLGVLLLLLLLFFLC